jgi:transcriptional regulator with XRE-family HTH domain
MQITDENILDAQSLGQRIRTAREKQGLSQEELAAKLGWGQRAISELERGKRKLAVTEVAQLAEGLNVSLLYFFATEVALDDLDIALLQHFHQVSDRKMRQTVVEIVRLLADSAD